MLRRDARAVPTTLGWLAGCAVVSLWWIGPLLILGRYAPPFTDFIESSFVTTRWLNLIEILRGTTSWAPFVDTEREAGFLLVSSPTFVLLTAAVAALGMWGLTLSSTPHRGLWVGMLLVGVTVLGAAHGPLSAQWLALLDGPLAPFRNLHKFDPLVRIPLLVGVAGLGTHLPLPRTLHPGRREAAAALVLVVGVAALAPAWSGRLLPRGTWDYVPGYWQEATNMLNREAAGTRTLIVPESSFARQTWGWTRDEPAQPLLDVPWAVRDAVPLIPAEAIRGLDGVMAVLHHDADAGMDALRRLGVGAVLHRKDLESGRELDLPGAQRFGDVECSSRSDRRHGADQRTPSGGRWRRSPSSTCSWRPALLVGADAGSSPHRPTVPTRLPHRPVSAAGRPSRADVRNAVPTLHGPSPRRDERRAGCHIGLDTSFGGADPRARPAAVDGEEDTALAGPRGGRWLDRPDRRSPTGAHRHRHGGDDGRDQRRAVELGEDHHARRHPTCASPSGNPSASRRWPSPGTRSSASSPSPTRPRTCASSSSSGSPSTPGTSSARSPRPAP